jgi:uncharacterized damage-inducible protein DinB
VERARAILFEEKIHMIGYNAKDMARSFRTVRANTIKIAEEIPEDKYGFRTAEGARTVAETLAHVAAITGFFKEMHKDRPTSVDFGKFAGLMQKQAAIEAGLTTKPKILEALNTHGEEFAGWLESLSDDVLADDITYPPGMEPPTKTRFEMLLSTKEHEMHHRAQLMVAERMLGIVPHLTRDMQARMAQFQQQQAQQQKAGG